MDEIELPNGATILLMGKPKDIERFTRIAHCRYAFTLAYMELKGWGENPEGLRDAQIREIQTHTGWRHPVLE